MCRRLQRRECHFNPRPRKEGDRPGESEGNKMKINFNPRPRKEGDMTISSSLLLTHGFQSTPSQRGRPMCAQAFAVLVKISIHALAKRATGGKRTCVCQMVHFNPRPRKEGDATKKLRDGSTQKFQSTPSQRGRPPNTKNGERIIDISIHALAKRATVGLHTKVSLKQLFQSTPSQRGRHSE
mgnify:CR=1 FL=1